MGIGPAAAPGQAGRPLHLQTARLLLAPLHSRSPAPGRGCLRGRSAEGGRRRRGGRHRARQGRGARRAAVLSRGRRAEGRRCRRCCCRLSGGDTDAGSGRGGESQRLPSDSLEPGHIGVAARVGVRGAGGAGSCCWGDPRARGRAGAGVGSRSRAVLGTRSPQPFPVQLTRSIPLSCPQCLRGKRKASRRPRGWVAGKERATLQTNAPRRAGQAGWGRTGSEGGVRAPGGPGTSGATLQGGGWGRGHSLVPPPAESAPRAYRRRVCGVWGPGEGALGATEGSSGTQRRK